MFFQENSYSCMCSLSFTGQDPSISAAAARYIRLSSPALVLITLSDVIRSVLTAQMDIYPCTGVFNTRLCFHFPLTIVILKVRLHFM